MPTPAVKVREVLAAKAGGKPTGSKSITTSTPAWKAKLQARTPTSKGPDSDRSATPAAAESSTYNEAENGSSASGQPAAAGKAVEAAEAALKLTFIAPVPLLPKPDLTRPQAPTDRSALLRQLQDLRSAGSRMLQEQQQQQLHPQQQHGAIALNATAVVGGVGSVFASSQLGLGHSQPQQQLAVPATPLAQGAFAAPRTPGTGARPALSPPSLAGLRLQESADTGGGFLTHYADPQDLTTMPEHGADGPGRSIAGTPGAGAGAGYRGLAGAGGLGMGGRLTFGAAGTPASAGLGGVGGGNSTPLSALRTVEKVQQLQRRLVSLQREGASLVAGMGED